MAQILYTLVREFGVSKYTPLKAYQAAVGAVGQGTRSRGRFRRNGYE